jgi:putative ABC transport system permease protein
MPGRTSPRLALIWLIASEWRTHPARVALTALAIAVGVALGFAVNLINHSAVRSFDDAMHGVNGAADLQVRAASPRGISERLYPKVAMLPGVADASPVVEMPATANGANFNMLGVDMLRMAAVTPSLLVKPAPLGDKGDNGLGGGLFLSETALRISHSRIGQIVMVGANGHRRQMLIAGTLPGVADGQSIGVIDIAAVQWHFDRLGQIDRIDMKLADDPADVRGRLAAMLPADALIANPDSDSAQGSAMSRAYRVNLDMLALVALLTGAFLVYSAQSLSVARRLRAFALIRTLGLPRGGIVATVALEGLLIGVIGAAAGLLTGYSIAWVALRHFGGSLGARYFEQGSTHFGFAPWAAFGFLMLGIFAAVAGSILPARGAARAAPAVALRNAGDVIDPRAPVPWKPAVFLLAIGGAMALLPAIDGLPLFGFSAIGLMLAGGIIGVPWFARRLLAPLVRRGSRHIASDLAIRHLHGAPGQAATALCGIVASTALMIAMAVMVTSFRTAVDQWVGQILAADVYVRVNGGAGFDRQTQARLAATPGVADIAFSRSTPLTVRSDRPPLTLIAQPVAGRGPATMVMIDQARGQPRNTIPVWVSEPAALIYGWHVGDRLTLPIGTGATFSVSGIWRDYLRQQGAITIESRDYDALTGDTARNLAAITLAPHADAANVLRYVVARAPPDIAGLVTGSETHLMRRFALELFDRSFAITYLLEGVAILVGLAGVAATMSAQTIARAREFGMLRHIGVGKGQIIAMLASEGALLGLIGGLTGVALGAILAQVLIHVVNPQSFNWTMTTSWPFGTMIAVIAALIVAAAGTAIIAGRRAVAIDAVRAVREDW